jgi:hypothetical protein
MRQQIRSGVEVARDETSTHSRGRTEIAYQPSESISYGVPMRSMICPEGSHATGRRVRIALPFVADQPAMSP